MCWGGEGHSFTDGELRAGALLEQHEQLHRGQEAMLGPSKKGEICPRHHSLGGRGTSRRLPAVGRGRCS